jgi:hypothetical protein
MQRLADYEFQATRTIDIGIITITDTYTYRGQRGGGGRERKIGLVSRERK